jgi:tetratricopeptide (TPR) repeat protein
MRVLIVDDQFSMRTIIKRMVQQMGMFEVIEDAGDGEEAWEKLTLQSFNLVISDVKMPRLDGIGLLKRCRTESEFKDLPFLIVSGEALPELVASAGEWGAYDYVLKPFSYSFLKDRITSIFERMKSPEETLFRELERLKEDGYADEALGKIGEFEKKNRSLKVKWLNLKGECLMQIGDMKQAAACMEQAMNLSDIFLPAFKNYAIIQQKLGNLEKAAEALERADRISPMDVERKFTLGKLMMQTGREEEGKKHLDKVLRQSSPTERAANSMRVAEAFMESGHFEEAEKLFIKAVQANPNEVEAYNRLGIALRRQGKFKEAERYYRLALQSNPENAAISYNLGVLYLKQQDRAQALKFLKKAFELDPTLHKADELIRRIEQQG